MEIQNYDDEVVILPKTNGKPKILSHRVYCLKFGGFVTPSVQALIDDGKNDVELSKQMDLSYICDGDEIEVSLEYLGEFKFKLVNISGNSKNLPNLELTGFHLYDDVAQFLLKNMGYSHISDNPQEIVEDPIDTSKIIGAH